MLGGLNELVDNNFTLLGIEEAISDIDRGLNMNLKTIEEVDEDDGDDGYIATYEHPSHRLRVTAYLDVFMTAEEAGKENLPPADSRDGDSPEHNGPRSHIKDRDSAPDIHNYIFTVNHIELSDIKKTYPEPM